MSKAAFNLTSFFLVLAIGASTRIYSSAQANPALRTPNSNSTAATSTESYGARATSPLHNTPASESSNRLLAQDPSTAAKNESEDNQNQQATSPIEAKQESQEQTDLGSSLAAMEQQYFGNSYEKDNATIRIERLEEFVFGAKMKGDMSTRIDRLKKIFSPRRPQVFSSSPSTTTGGAKPGAALPGNPQAKIENSSSSQTQTQTPQAGKSKKSLLAIINRGIDNYNRHRFHNAEDDFNNAVDMAPGLSRIYAYLGVTLLQLNERAAAMDALEAAYELDPFGAFGRYSKNCLIILAGDEEIRRRGPKDDMKTVEKTLSKVNNQANADASRFNKLSGTVANDRANTVSRFTSRLSSEMFASSDGYSNDYALRSSYARTDANVQMANARRDATLRAAYAKEAANNLKSLMTAKVLPGGARLRAFGTTLNTRYYGDETKNLAPWYIPREYPPELRAQARSYKAISQKRKANGRTRTTFSKGSGIASRRTRVSTGRASRGIGAFKESATKKRVYRRR